MRVVQPRYISAIFRPPKTACIIRALGTTPVLRFVTENTCDAQAPTAEKGSLSEVQQIRTNGGALMKLLNTHQAAQVLNEPEGTLRYWRCAGKGPAYIKLAGRVRYDEADVIAYVNANKRIPSVRATLEGNRIGTLSA